MIDAILRAVEVMMTAEIGPHETDLELHADDGRLVVTTRPPSVLPRQVLGTLRSDRPRSERD
jgi:hypothetical protein